MTDRQTIRQLDVLRTLQTHSRYGITTASLATAHYTTIRTIQRDLRDLRGAGFIITPKRQPDRQTYHKLESVNLPPINFALTEVSALLFIESISDFLQGTPYKDHLRDVIRRIETLLSKEQVDFLRQAAQAYAPHIRGHKTLNQNALNVITHLNRAILDQRVCQIKYRSIEGKKAKSYPIEPLRLLYYMEAGGLYLIARASDYQKPITLAVERIEDLEISEDPFSISSSNSQSIEDRLRNSFGIISGEPFAVKVYFSPQQAPYIQERTWHPSQTIEKQKGGGIVISFHASSEYEIKRWVLQFGADAEVLEPDALRREIAEELQKALIPYT